MAACAADVELLQRHHVGAAAGDHAGDALGVEFAVHADAGVHVIGHYAQRAGGALHGPSARRRLAPPEILERGAAQIRGPQIRAAPHRQRGVRWNQREAAGLLWRYAAMRAVLGGEGQCVLPGSPAQYYQITGVRMLA
jgi:hypothetical protein